MGGAPDGAVAKQLYLASSKKSNFTSGELQEGAGIN